MKKQIWLVLALLLATMTIPVSATGGTLFPVSVSEYMQGENPRISRVYSLESTDDPAEIPTYPFERDGYRYGVHEITQSGQSFTEEQAYSETVTVESKSKEDLTELFEPEILYESPDGFSGVLTLDADSITAEPTAYGNSSYTVSDTQTYPSLSMADISLLPKTMSKNGTTLDLVDVDWQEVNGLYTATAKYSKTVPTTYASNYGVTATYSGNLIREVQGETLYTVVYGGTALETEEIVIPPPVELVEVVEVEEDTEIPLSLIVAVATFLVATALLVYIVVSERKEAKQYAEQPTEEGSVDDE